jgi:thioredoxin 1
MKPIELNDNTFEKLIRHSATPVLVDFSADWCPPCRMMYPVLDSLATDMDQKVTIAKLDVDANPEATAKFGIRNLPTIVLFKNGMAVERIVGAVPKSVLLKKLEKLAA